MGILIDIGANHGQYTDAQENRFSFTVLVEANPFLSIELKEKYKDSQRYAVVHAMASKDMSGTFYVCNSADQISTADFEWVTQSRFTKDYAWRPLEGIPTVSLDTLIQRYPGIERIKIDVEGYEYNVLQSLHTKVPEVCFEWAEEKKEELLLSVSYLQSLGYTKFHVQFQDAYTYSVPSNEWISFSDVYGYLTSLCQKDRKELWGMIWAS